MAKAGKTTRHGALAGRAIPGLAAICRLASPAEVRRVKPPAN